MTLDTLDFGQGEAGSISNTKLETIGIEKIEYDKVLSMTDAQLTHMTATTTDGKVIDLGNYDIAAARDLIRSTILNTDEGFSQLLKNIEGV